MAWMTPYREYTMTIHFLPVCQWSEFFGEFFGEFSGGHVIYPLSIPFEISGQAQFVNRGTQVKTSRDLNLQFVF